MPILAPYPLSGADATRLNNLTARTNENNLVAGPGINVRKTSHGTVISSISDDRKDNMTNQGLYDVTQEYFVNDVVWVDPNQGPYLNFDGQPLPLCSGSSSTGGPPLGCGAYVCILYVAPSIATSSYYVDNVLPTIESGSSGFDTANQYRWNEYNVYYPIYPAIPTSSLAVANDEAAGNIQANANYWAPLNPMFLSTTCQADGTFSNAFISGVLSGSSFNLDQLPY